MALDSTINTQLRDHITLAGRRLAKLAAQYRNTKFAEYGSREYENLCINSMPSLILCVLALGSDEMHVEPAGEPPAGLTERETLFAQAILVASCLDHRTKANLEGQVKIRAAVADFARRLAAIHTSQDLLELDCFGGVTA